MGTIFTKMIAKLEKSENLYSDEQIYEDMRRFSKEEAGLNCESAAYNIFIVLSSVCSYRESLAPILVRTAIRPLFYWGLYNLDEIIHWIDWFCEKESKNNNGREIHTSLNGIIWLKNKLSKDTKLIEKTLNELEAVYQLYDVLFSIKLNAELGKVTLNFIKNETSIYKEFVKIEELIDYLESLLIEKYENIFKTDQIDSRRIITEELEEFMMNLEKNGLDFNLKKKSVEVVEKSYWENVLQKLHKIIKGR